MRARISIIGNDIICERDGEGPNREVRIPLTDEALKRLDEWSGQYRRAVRSGDPSPLPGLGVTMFGWLDENKWASGWVKGTGDRVLEIAVDDPEHETAAALLDLPWEIVAHKGDFLAADPVQSFVVFRSIGRPANSVPLQPTYRDLAMMFMAAAPEGVQELDFEAEEAAILDATERLPVQVVVEESGCADFLKDRLAQDGPFEVVHVSCHGNILPNKTPVLALETPEGGLALTNPGKFAGALGERKPQLVFLSACRTAEAEAIEPFARGLVRAGVPNVLGWDGSVYDADAILFASALYGELAEHATVPFAAAVARRKVLAAHREDRNKGHHWHLARVYGGRKGAGQCCDRGLEKRPLRKDAGFKEFLDKARSRVRVATAQEFVGRRRQAQAVLRAFRDAKKAGVLVFGMGSIGKSSLAARVANRMPRHETVVVYDLYDAPAIFERLVAALLPSERTECERTWREKIRSNGATLGYTLEEMLKGPFDKRPVLLIIDDLEQVLEDPRPDQAATPVKDAPGTADAWRIALTAVLRAFDAADTESRLLLTSRYDFALPDGKGAELAATLERVQLRAMEPNERAKQWRAAERIAGRAEEEKDEQEPVLIARRGQAVAGGNPGLQEVLCRPILSRELDAAADAIDAVEKFKASGKVPEEENAAREFFERVSFETYRNALTDAQRTQLRAATLFSEGLPIPVAALEAGGLAAGVADPAAALSRLIGLGLVDGWGKILGVEHAAVNPLARSLAGQKLTYDEQKYLAAAAIAPLMEAWQDTDGDFPRDPRGVEAARLALIGNAPVKVLQATADAASYFLIYHAHAPTAALSIMMKTLEQIEVKGESAHPEFLLHVSLCAERTGEIDLQIDLLEKALSLASDDKVSQAKIAVEHAQATIARDGPEKALEKLWSAATLFNEVSDERSWAITLGTIADILLQRGETDEALRIYQKEVLPAFKRLDDMQSCAVIMSRIADILWKKGESDEALRIWIEECLPAVKEIGDIDGLANIRYSCARLRLARGGLEHGEAPTIRNELAESFILYTKLQHPAGIAFVGSLFGQILADEGRLEEAFTVLDDSVAAFERLKLTDKAAEVRELQKEIWERKG